MVIFVIVYIADVEATQSKQLDRYSKCSSLLSSLIMLSVSYPKIPVSAPNQSNYYGT